MRMVQEGVLKRVLSMESGNGRARRRGRLPFGLVSMALALLIAGCGSPASSVTPTATAGGGTPTAPVGTAPQPTAALPLLSFKVTPDTGPVGTPFTITGDGLPANKSVEFGWATVNGAYVTEVADNHLVFRDRKFTPTRLPLGTAASDGNGHVTAKFAVPEDFGEVHDIYAVVDGVDVARSGFFITRSYNLSPDSGPIGTLMTLEVKGLGPGPMTSTMALRYDNKYTGWISGTTTRGTAKAQFRAAGPVGKHLVEALPASALTPFINIEQTSVSYLLPFRAQFTVTGDKGPPALASSWPSNDRVRVDDQVRGTGIGGVQLALPNATARMTPGDAVVGSSANLSATGLPSGAAVQLAWVTAVRSDRFGANLGQIPLGEAKVAADGTLSATVTVPDSLGGRHAVWIMQGGQVLVEAPFVLDRSMAETRPARVKEGEIIKIRMNGVGWNDLDSGVAVTYDNAYIGYGCGSSAGGDVELTVVATGGLGTHLIDLYPMIYDSGQSGWPWQYNLPQLTALDDHPGLGVGYRLPIFRMAIEIIP